MNPETLLILLVVVADIALWAIAITVPLSSTNQFRVYALAVLLLYVIAGGRFGWGLASAVGGLAVWIAAVAVACLRGSAITT